MMVNNSMPIRYPAYPCVIARPKGLIVHKGIYLWNNLVFHNTREKGEHLGSLEEFAGGHPFTIESRIDLPPYELDRRVRAALATGESYNALFNNCEHTVARIVEGKPSSRQAVAAGVALAALVFVVAASQKA